MQSDDILSPYEEQMDDFVVPSIDQRTGAVAPNAEQVNDLPVFPPAKMIDLMSLQDIVQKLNNAVKARTYPEAIKHATVAIDYQFSLYLLDIRSFCYAMHGQKRPAIADAQRMIEYWPSRATGYLRKGGILSLYGQQAQAIEAFDEGLRNTDGFDNSQLEQLKRAKEAARSLNATRIDLISQLPSAPVNDILSRLPLDTIAKCLIISKVWRQKTLDYKDLWRDLSICDDDPISIEFTNVIPYAASHIQHLEIDSSSEVVRETCFNSMIEGSFMEIQSLEMTCKLSYQVLLVIFYLQSRFYAASPARSTQNLRSHLPMISQAFLAVRNTLTSISLNLSDNNNAITLADVLLGCCSVTTLVYITECSMSSMIGDLSPLKKYHSLASLQLKAKPVVGSDIKLIMERCPRLRRLVMNGFDDDTMTVVDAIKASSSMESLGYNFREPVPDLQMLVDKTPGLREIYVDGFGNPVDQILLLLYNNMKTLQIVNVSISVPFLSESQLQQLYTAYPRFKLERLTSLSLHAIDSGLQLFLLRSIPETTALKYLHIRRIHNMEEMVDIVIEYPPPDILCIGYCDDMDDNSSELARLFKRYAKISESHHSLRAISMESCGSAVTDSVLASLASIKTLQAVQVTKDPKSVTREGFGTFLDKMKRQLTMISLNEMESITDFHLAEIGRFDRLKQLTADQLLNITDQGIHSMLDEGCHSLEVLIVTDCPSVTEQSIVRAKMLVEVVEYLPYE